MSTTVYISDDGDEEVIIRVNEDTIARINHEDFGWDGMDKVVKLVEELGEAFGFQVSNLQDIV